MSSGTSSNRNSFDATSSVCAMRNAGRAGSNRRQFSCIRVVSAW